MSTDVSRVYQFLAKQGDWKAIADENGDGTVIKSEFRTFMENNFEWNGEDASAQNDLINNFWKTIDTKQSGSLKGTNLKNKNALDSNELATMDKKIAYYEVLNDFTADLSAPSVVSDSANWKKSVSDGLAALVEKYRGSVEDLATYLDDNAPLIQNKATADYCKEEYLNNDLKALLDEYDYNDYNTNGYALKSIIDNYVQSLDGTENVEDIQQTVVDIIDAFFATAGLAQGNECDLSQYGYNANANSKLNELQVKVLTKTLEADLAGSDLKEDYENNTELFKTAMESYISGLKYGDFATVSADVLGSFKSSDAYKSVEKNIQVQELLVGDEFKNALTTNISESIANTIINDGKYLTVMKEIKTDALEKAQNGEFDNNDGALDTSAVITYLIEQVSSRLAEFYPNGFGDMSLSELNVTYDKLVEAADKQEGEEKQLEARKNAAIEYCKALSEKSTKLAEIVKDAFGDNYATEISTMMPSKIDGIITELKAKALEIGDASTFTLSAFNSGIDNNRLTLETNTASSHKFSASVMNGNTAIDSTRITFELSNNAGLNCSMDVATNTLTVNSPTAGTYTIEVAIIVDGVQVGEKQKITIVIKPSNAEIINKATTWNGANSEHLEIYNVSAADGEGQQITSKGFAELYNNFDATIQLHVAMDCSSDRYGDQINIAKDRITQLGNLCVEALSTAGLDKNILSQAANNVVLRYQGTIDSVRHEDNSGKHASNMIGNICKHMNENRESYGHRICVGWDTDGKDSFVFAVRFRDFVDDIIAEYWNLAG